jgi:acetyl-CoA C-acetyltransferase
MIGFPYPKYMNSNIQTDQAAALILCSVSAAQAAGVPEDRWVFVHAGADAYDHWWISERWSLSASPALAVLGQAVGGVADVDHVDLYSCFPSAVQMAMAALGLRGRDTRPLTVTGGLPFAGGPGNNYVTHSIAAMIDECRRDPGSFGVVTGLGWYVTKHSAGVYSTTPPAAGYRRADPKVTQAAIDALPRRVAAGAYDGPATVEASSIPFDRDGNPSLGIIALLAPDGRRVLANTREPAVLKSMCEEEWADRTVAVRSDGTMNTIEV